MAQVENPSHRRRRRSGAIQHPSASENFNNEMPLNLWQLEKRNGWINVGDLQGAVHFKIVKYEKIKFLVIALRDSIEIYAWAPRPYHKFMAFKVRLFRWFVYLTAQLFYISPLLLKQSFGDLAHRPLLVDLTIEEGTRLKVIYGSAEGFHAIDLDSSSVYDIYIPKHVWHVIFFLFRSWSLTSHCFLFFRSRIQLLPIR